MTHILLAEDDENLGYVIQDQLTYSGFSVTHAVNGEEAERLFLRGGFEVCLIDLMMPKMDGFTLARKIRAVDEFIPIIFITARSLEEDKIKGFEIGGDDYIVKPFSIQELILRIKVFLKRTVPTAERSSLLTVGKLKLDCTNLVIMLGTETTPLTQMECDLLRLLIENQNNLVKREDILVKIWGENDYFKGRSLDVFISRLRKYLSSDPSLEIRNHHGVGFTLMVQQNANKVIQTGLDN